MALQAKELAELIQRGNLPFARLQDAQDLNHSENLGHLASAENTCWIVHRCL